MPADKGSGRHASVLLDSTACNSKSYTESEIIEQVRRGSASALEQLMDLYERRLLRLALRLTNTYEDAEEVVQTAFLKAFYNLNSFRGDSSFYTWIVRIARNEALMKIRRRRPEFVSIDDHDLEKHEAVAETLEAAEPSPEEHHSLLELRRIIEHGMGELTAGNRLVFQLHDIEEFSSHEIARTLKLSAGAVKSRLLRARLQLRNFFNVYVQTERQF
jgi:RNA polymerase sigma-70 factor (ECF subfamily)